MTTRDKVIRRIGEMARKERTTVDSLVDQFRFIANREAANERSEISLGKKVAQLSDDEFAEYVRRTTPGEE